MEVELGRDHFTPHFHAYYQDDVGIFGINPIELLAGDLTTKAAPVQVEGVLAELHQDELKEDWSTLHRRTVLPSPSSHYA